MDPPPLQGELRRESNEVSIRSWRSLNSVLYQRPFQLQYYHGLADFRSMRVRLRNYIASSSTSTISTFAISASTGSSGVPPIGYLSGQAVKRVGEKTLDAFIPLEIYRQSQAISGLISQLENIPRPNRSKWIFNRKRKINCVVENLLELST